MSRSSDHVVDVTKELLLERACRLDWVGMEQVAFPILWGVTAGQVVGIPSLVDVGVSLEDETARGVHMSRLYTTLQNLLGQKPLSFQFLQDLLAQLVAQQKELSLSGQIKVSFQMPVERKALVSEHQGWRYYPVEFQVKKNKNTWHFSLCVEVLYSSTCPCSAALAQQYTLEQFRSHYAGKDKNQISFQDVEAWWKAHGGVATPHAQRSRAKVEVAWPQPTTMTPLELIDLIEKSLGTPVQTAVKRVDEQEFARLNGAHQMFCEDAARRIQQALHRSSQFPHYQIMVEHQESLHAHNAVARVSSSSLLI